MNVLRWLVALVLAGLFFFMAWFKFAPELAGGDNPVFPLIAKNTGIALVEPYFRWLTGALELFTGFLLLTPQTRRAGAGLGLCILIGALVAHLVPGILGIDVPGQGKSIFYMAIVMTVLTLFTLFFGRHHIAEPVAAYDRDVQNRDGQS